MLAHIFGIDDEPVAALVRRLEGDLVEHAFHHRLETPRADILDAGIELHGNVGERNAAFVQTFLKNEKIRIVAEDLEDIYPRKVYFFPRTGKVLVKKLMQTHNDTLAQRENDYANRLKAKPVAGEVELF